MCVTAPGQVVALGAEGAEVEVDGRRRAASTFLEPDIRVGDWVIVVGGAILRRVDPTTAAQMAAARSLATTPPPPAPTAEPGGFR
jgi:hydrogenase assembly chaperone HypC/HupF